jgi:hypothetical protein
MHFSNIHSSVHNSNTHNLRRLQARELAELVIGLDVDAITPAKNVSTQPQQQHLEKFNTYLLILPIMVQVDISLICGFPSVVP